MSYHTFYDPDLSATGAGDRVILAGAEGRHAAQARRIRVGEIIDVVDGRGRRVRAEVTQIAKSELTAAALEVRHDPPPEVSLTLVQALAKGGRDETAIEAATELGVDSVVAWEAERSVSKWRAEKVEKGVQRWEAIIAGAMKQSRRSQLPTMRGYVRGEAILDVIAPAGTVLVLHETAAQPITGVDLPEAGEVVLVVGPEGGLTDAEVAMLTAETAGHAVLLGREVLRTSTAGPAAIAVLNSRLGRW